VVRRAGVWRDVLATFAISAHDRVLLGLPLASATALDAQPVLAEMGALTLATDGISPNHVIQRRPTMIVCTPTDALRLSHAAVAVHTDLADGALRLAILTGEPGASLDVTRRLIEDRWGGSLRGCVRAYRARRHRLEPRRAYGRHSPGRSRARVRRT
jgi:hypothetical protein